MHATVEQLLAKRDSEPLAVDVAVHVESCARCQDELARIAATTQGLGALGDFVAPDVWPKVATVLTNRQTAREPRAWLGAVAAAFALAASVWLFVSQPGGVPQREAAVPTAPTVTPQPLTLLVDRSQALERNLRRLRNSAPAIVRLGHDSQREELEQRLRALDYGLLQAQSHNAGGDIARIYWNERVRLMNSLVELERAELVERGAAEVRVVPASR